MFHKDLCQVKTDVLHMAAITSYSIWLQQTKMNDVWYCIMELFLLLHKRIKTKGQGGLFPESKVASEEQNSYLWVERSDLPYTLR